MSVSNHFINRLPAELLALVFINALPTIHLAKDVKPLSLAQSPLNVSHVCRDWRRLALSTPQLWARVHFNINRCSNLDEFYNKTQSVNAFLKRSSNVELVANIVGIPYYSAPMYKIGVSTEDWANVGNLVLKPIVRAQNRWRSLRIIMPVSLWLFAYEKDEMPSIGGCNHVEELELQFVGFIPLEDRRVSRPEPWQVDIDIARWSKVRRLCLGDWNTMLLDNISTNLAHLTSFRLPISSYYPIDTIFNVLAQAPQLEELQIRQPFSEFQSQPITVCLPRLRKLHLIGPDDLQIVRPYNNAREGQMENILNRLTLPFLQRLYIDAGEVGNPDVVVHSMCDMLERSSAPLLKLALQFPRLQDETLLRCLHSVPLLESLSFSPCYFDPVALLNGLIAHENLELVATLCPQLQGLTLKYISPSLHPILSQILLSRSPPGGVDYEPPQSARHQLKTFQVARYGTRVLQVLNIANRFDNGSFEDEEGLRLTPNDDVDQSLVEDEMVARLISRGLKVAFNTGWVW